MLQKQAKADESQSFRAFEVFKAFGESLAAVGVVALFFLALTYAESLLR